MGGRIICVSGARGRCHDFKLLCESRVAFGGGIDKVEADSGYQGLQQRCKVAQLPVKGSKHKPLSRADKDHNRGLASTRVKVEHAVRTIKVFRIFKGPYRNRRRRFFLRMNLTAAIVNLNMN